MCGIIGVTGAADRVERLLAGLEMLEYRGYDSAGIALVDAGPGPVWRIRAAERGQSIAKLRASAGDAPVSAAAGIAHTRWATHGAPSETNAHPHLDCTGRLALVHNGIIENHREIAARLEAGGHVLASETDTEVIPHLVEDELAAGAALVEAVRRSLDVLRGDFAVAVVSADEPEALVAARRTSPLIVGCGETAGVVASDIAAALETARELYALDDDQVAEVRSGALRVVDRDGRPVEPRRIEVSWTAESAQKGGYPDFMSKEIHEQPLAVADTLAGRVSPDGRTEIEELALGEAALRDVQRVVLVACGSSYHAALVGRQAIEQWAGIAAEADIASEFRYRDSVLGEGTLVVAVSQSGETVDTLHAMREARRRGATVVALSNVVDSLMAREADGVLYTRAGPEIGVASTKCHVAQLTMLDAFALHLARIRGALPGERLADLGGILTALPVTLRSTLAREAEYAAVAEQFADVRDFYYLGRRTGFPVALEGALKLKELAYVRAEAYAAGEMKHGPISLIEPGSVVVAMAKRTALWEKVMSNVAEMRARGATIVALCDVGDAETARLADAVLEVPHLPELISPIVDVVPLQLFAYAIACARGHDVDRPRNLAKVVTVE